jgi:para-nitrobenzyl esterase
MRVNRIALVVVIAAAAADWAWQWSTVAHGQADTCLVTTLQGDVRGIDRGQSCEFRAVPFGASTAGARRWMPPVAATAWAPAVLDATVPGPFCPQINAAGQPVGIEDCLKLNIWAPHSPTGRPLPVIIWLHGGSFISASGSFAGQNGTRFVEENKAVVVAPNYRLGPFGFLGHSAFRRESPDYSSAGNYGFLDQRLALEWVRAHIAAFGGDPNRITIAGASAGGLSVGLHLVSAASHGLFERAVMQGGFPSYRWRTREDAEAQGDAFAAALGCTDAPQVVTCLRAKTLGQVLGALPVGTEQLAETGRTHWGPTVDGLEIQDQPRTLFETGSFSRVPIIIGSNRDDGWTFVNRSFPGEITQEQYESALATEFGADAAAILAAYPTAAHDSPKDALGHVATDAEYACGATRLARLIGRTNTPVYLYQFEYVVDAVTPGRAVHGLDINFLFGTNVGVPLLPPPTTYILSAEDLEFSRIMAGYWGRFTKRGDPNRDDKTIVRWPAFKRPAGEGSGADRYLVLDDPVTTKRMREAQCAFWEPYFFRSISAAVPADTP